MAHLAELYLRIAAARQASELLEPSLEDHPQHAALPLAQGYADQGIHLSASETLAKFQAETPEKELRASVIRAEIRRISGEPTEALAILRGLLESQPSNPEVVTGLLKTQLNLNQAQIGRAHV